ncbi:MAG: putative sulfate exporter family transporter [Deltaproteobacteria bacterium]|nr:putative sulfate exporter family transporter [Deltaproteobacteria bacterium]
MKKLFATEDWWAVWLGLVIVVLALPVAFGTDLLGWVVKTNVWLDPAKAFTAASKTYAEIPGLVSLFLTYLVMTALLGMGSFVMRFSLKRFLAGFGVIFWISAVCWFVGHYAYIAQTPDKLEATGIGWSLGLTGEAGFIVALLAGLAIGNLSPRLTLWLKEACRPEWYIKTAIVILGASLGIKAAGATGLMTTIMLRGLAAIIEAYLVYWAVVYFVARKYFKFSREWAVPLASGISICGVSAAIATGAAIRARPVVPIMVSSLVVVFAVVELIILPFAAQTFLSHEPMVAAAWMGLAVKTDGAAVASGAITDALIRAKAAGYGVNWEPGWMLTTTTTIKIFIDVFIGFWALILAIVWVYAIDKKPGEKVQLKDIGQRFPKFVFGYFLLFLLTFAVALAWPQAISGLKDATGEADVFRGLFFVVTFFTIGLSANFKKLWAEGIGRLALVYVICLFGFIIWVGLGISWLFFHGVFPPLVNGGS